MKARITLSLDVTLLREIRELASQEGTPVATFMATHLEQRIRERKTYDRARKRALSRLEKGFDLRWTPSSSRDDLHKR